MEIERIIEDSVAAELQLFDLTDTFVGGVVTELGVLGEVLAVVTLESGGNRKNNNLMAKCRKKKKKNRSK